MRWARCASAGGDALVCSGHEGESILGYVDAGVGGEDEAAEEDGDDAGVRNGLGQKV